MINFIVIGACLLLLVAVIYIAAKPISMGIEARRNIKDQNLNDEDSLKDDDSLKDEFKKDNINNTKNYQISDELIKLNKLKVDGIITETEYEKAKDKLLS